MNRVVNSVFTFCPYGVAFAGTRCVRVFEKFLFLVGASPGVLTAFYTVFVFTFFCYFFAVMLGRFPVVVYVGCSNSEVYRFVTLLLLSKIF